MDTGARREHRRVTQLARRSMPEGRATRLLYSAKRRASQKNIAFGLSRDWVLSRLKAGTCELSGLPFDLTTGGRAPYTPSIDRIDNSKGYTVENCRVILWALNAAFSTWGECVFREISLAWLRRNRADSTKQTAMDA